VPVTEVRTPFSRSRWVSLPYTDYCPPLVRADADAEAVAVALNYHARANRIDDLEIRAELPRVQAAHAVDAGYRQWVELPSDPENLHPKKNHRNARNKAQKRGVRVTRESSAEAVAIYYRLHSLTRRRLGVPVQPRRFFDLIAERLVLAGHGFVAIATLDDEVVASGLYLAYNGTMVAKYGASDPARQDTGAGYLIDWEVMAAACREGYHTLDFGRTDAEAEGLRLYKAGWGSTESPLVYTHLSEREPSPTVSRMGDLSKQVIRRSPVWVCRALGEVFYRWAA